MTTDSRQKSIDKIARGGIWLIIGIAISKAFSYIYKIIVARIGTEEFGIFSASTALVDTVSTIAALGLPAAIFYFIPHYEARNEKNKLNGVIRSSLKLTFLMSIAFAVVLFASADLIADKFLHNARTALILRILAFIIPVANMRSALIKILIGFQKIKFRVYARNIAEDGSRLLVTLVLLVMGFGLMSAIYGYMAGMVVSLIIALYLLEKRTFSFTKKAGTEEVSHYRDILKYSLPLFMAGFVGYFLRWTDTFVLSYFRTMEEVGIYNAAMIMAGFITIIPELFMPSAYPVIVSSFSAGNKEDAMHLVRVVNKWILLLAIPVVVLLYFTLKDLITFLFGNKYNSALGAAAVLMAGKFLWTISNMGSRMLTMIRKNTTILYINIALVSINLILDIILVPRYGIMGAAFPTAFSLLMEFAVYMYLAREHFGITLLSSKTPILAAAGIAAALPVWWLDKTVHIRSLYIIGIESCTYLFIYALILWFLRALTEDDLVVIRMAVKKIKELQTK